MPASRALDWFTSSAELHLQDLVFAGYQAVTGSRLYRELPIHEEQWLTIASLPLPENWRSFIYPGLRGVPDWLIPARRYPSFIRKMFGVQYERFEITADAFSSPETTVNLGWSMLKLSTATQHGLDTFENAFALSVIGLGANGLRSNSYCEVCFRVATAGVFRCPLHSRSKSADRKGRRPPEETDVRIAEQILDKVRESDEDLTVAFNISGDRWQLGYPVPFLPVLRKKSRHRRASNVDDAINLRHDPVVSTSRVPIAPPSQFHERMATSPEGPFWQHEEHVHIDPADSWESRALRDIVLRQGVLNALEESQEIRRALESSPRVLERVGTQVLDLSIEEQVRIVRAAIDPDNPVVALLPLSIRMAEEWYRLISAIQSIPEKRETSRKRVEEIRRRIAIGELKSKIAQDLNISAPNLSNLLKRYASD
ncbi:MAG: hypothetical protein V4709_05330 [Pseudomonadota bacterium]